MGWILGAVALFAVGSLWRRKWRRHRLEDLWRQQEGYNADQPFVVSTFAAADERRGKGRCLCGGTLRLLGEDSRAARGGRTSVRVSRCECYSCERVVELYFVVGEVLH